MLWPCLLLRRRCALVAFISSVFTRLTRWATAFPAEALTDLLLLTRVLSLLLPLLNSPLLQSSLSEVQCVEYVLQLIADSLDAWRTRQYDYYQRVLNGIL